MAKGNIGNLLQHFVALNVAEKVVNYWNKPESPIEYVDCFSMAPWESLDCTQPQGFKRLINTFPTRSDAGDFVANVFINVWNGKYDINNTPVKVKDRSIRIQQFYFGLLFQIKIGICVFMILNPKTHRR